MADTRIVLTLAGVAPGAERCDGCHCYIIAGDLARCDVRWPVEHGWRSRAATHDQRLPECRAAEQAARGDGAADVLDAWSSTPRTPAILSSKRPSGLIRNGRLVALFDDDAALASVLAALRTTPAPSLPVVCPRCNKQGTAMTTETVWPETGEWICAKHRGGCGHEWPGTAKEPDHG